MTMLRDDGLDKSTDMRCSASHAELDARFQRDAIPLRNRLFNAALRLTRNRQDAEDLLQDTMLLGYVGFASFRDGTNLTAWLYRIMLNSWINQCRKRRRRLSEVSIEAIADNLLTANMLRIPNAARSAEIAALDSLPDADLKAALAALHEESRMTVYYADVEGLRYKEIAHIMNAPIGTVMSRLHRGRQMLRAHLGQAGIGQGYEPVSVRKGKTDANS